MGNRLLFPILLVLAIASFGILACDVSTITSQFGIGSTVKPTVSIQSPATGSQFREGDDIIVQSTARDPSGIIRVEMSVDGAAVRSDAPPVPQGQVVFTLVQNWRGQAGTHTITVRAFNASGVGSDPALITILVVPATAQGPTGSVTIAPSATPSPLGQSTQAAITPQATLTQTRPVTTTEARTATRPAPTRTPTPVISGPPGVYALSIRVDPLSPRRGQNATFFVTFVNTTGNPQEYRWRINIYEPEKRNPFGDTSPINSTIPPGRSEIASLDNWAVRGPGDCMSLIARVFWIDPDSKSQTEFTKPDGSPGPATGFQVCP